jgi:hypothetical protein
MGKWPSTFLTLHMLAVLTTQGKVAEIVTEVGFQDGPCSSDTC